MRRLPAAPSALAAALGAALLLAACAGTGPPLPTAPPPGLAPEADDLRDVLEDMAEGDSLLVRRLYVSGLTPVFDGLFRLTSGPIVAFIPGRHPTRGDELVVAAATVGTPGAAALMEEARLLNRRAAFTVAPERTVLVAFLPRGAGARGLASVLDAPVWVRSLVAAVLVVGEDAPGPFQAVGGEREVPVEVIAAPGVEQGPVAEALALAASLRTALTAAANGAPATPDVDASPADSLRGPRLPVDG